MKIVLTTISILAALALPCSSYAATPEEDVQAYINIFSGESAKHSDAADTFAWKGLSDTRIFDLVEQRLLLDHPLGDGDRLEKNRVARYIRALGFSGQPKYISTIARFDGHSIYARYATAALKDQPNYQKWNAIISNRSTFDPAKSDDVNRVMNMLKSDDIFLQRIGAKRVYFDVRDEDVLKYLEQLVHNFNPEGKVLSPQYNDTYAWMVKALRMARKD